jgi:hypothetical protein
MRKRHAHCVNRAGKPTTQQAIFSGVIVMSFDANKNMITAAFITQFHDSFEIAAQQKDSRLQAAVHDRGMITGEAFTINDMGTIEMTQITTRFGDTVWDLPEAGTRNALMADYGVFVPVEKRDLRKLLADPQGLICSSPWRPPTAKKTMLFIARCSIPYCAKRPAVVRMHRLRCQLAKNRCWWYGYDQSQADRRKSDVPPQRV